MHGIAPFNELGPLTVSAVGRHGQELGSLAQKGARVAPGFAVTSAALKEFVILSGIRDRVFSLLRARKADQLHALILEQEAPEELEEDLFSHCTRLKSEAFTCHSSSAFGDHDFSLRAASKHKLIDAVKACWASIVTPERINDLTKSNLFSAVIVQAEPSEPDARKGRIYTINPLTNSKEKFLIEVTQPTRHLLLVNRGTSNVINEGDFHTLTSPLFIDDKDKIVELGAQVQTVHRKPQVIDWTRIEDAFYITRVREFDTDEKARFLEKAKQDGVLTVLGETPSSSP